MGSENKRVFPLSRQFYEDFKFYYAFGNTPPEDFLQSVSLADCREPTILSLGCGDMRSPMFTILNNFGLEGEISDGFRGVHFVLNDRSGSVLARNILFLYLCMLLPGSGVERKRWIASMWSIWYNHELQPQHNDMLLSALEELCRWSVSWQEWSKCLLGQLVKFSSPATFAAVKKVWSKWQSFSKSVKDMKLERNHFQFHHMKRHFASKTREDCLKKFVEQNKLLFDANFICCHEKLTIFQKEILEFLTCGFSWAETVLGVSISTSETVVNPTLFEHVSGLYTLHYGSIPYMGYTLSFLYTHAELSKTLGQTCSLLTHLPVNDVYFQSKPLLANCVQQFTMWLQATANMIARPSHNSSLSFTFILEYSESFCFSMLRFPENYSEPILQFDAIYTSNLLDNLSPPALVFNALPLLKPTGTLFTATFRNLSSAYLQHNFGFSPELFPPLLGVHCIGHDGPYSPAVNHNPQPFITPQSEVFIWRNVNLRPLLLFDDIKESSHAIESLLKLYNETVRLGTEFQAIASAESFLCALHQFLKQVKSTTPVNQFLQPLCDAICSETHFKPYLMQLQTQSLLHDIHMHLTLTEDDCPICRGQPLDSYIQQFTLSLEIDSLGIEPYNTPTFDLHLVSNSGDHKIMKSFCVSCFDSELLNLTFYMPKHILSHYHFISVKMYKTSTSEPLFLSCPVENIKCSPTFDYVFLKKSLGIKKECPLGHVVKHIGDMHKFETIILPHQAEVSGSELNAQCLQPHQLKLSYRERGLTILYPYAIDESKTHIKIFKKKHIISVVVHRKGTQLLNEKLTYFIDPRNEMTRPNLHCGIDKMERYCSLQLLCNVPDHSLFEAKQSFSEIFKRALNGERIFTFSLPSKHVAGAPDMHVFVYIHNVRFTTAFATPSLDVSYCFLETRPRHIIYNFLALIRNLGPYNHNNIMIHDAEYKLLKDIFKYYSSIVRCPFPCSTNRIAQIIKEYNFWGQLDHAVLFPLYPNPANPEFLKFIGDEILKEMEKGLDSESILAMIQGKINACSFCQASVAPLKCEKCRRANYCSDECQKRHQIFHSLFCNNEESASSSCSNITGAPKTHASFKTDEANEYMRKYSPNTGNNSMCARCKKPAAILCQCQKVSYCSKACQTLEQPEHSEKCQQASCSDKGPLTQSRESSTQYSTATTVGADCARCKKPAAILCQCQKVSYCSKECQTLEWPGHSEKCRMSSAIVPKSHPSTKTEVPSGKPKAHSTHQHSGIECVRCKKPAAIVCQCKQVSYCSEICQNLEWPVHGETCFTTSPDPPQSQSYSTPERSKRVKASEDSNKVATAQKCYNCGKTKSSLKHCKCRNVMYCSVECQRLHWPQHKSTCITK